MKKLSKIITYLLIVTLSISSVPAYAKDKGLKILGASIGLGVGALMYYGAKNNVGLKNKKVIPVKTVPYLLILIHQEVTKVMVVI